MERDKLQIDQFADWVIQHRDEWSVLCGVSRRVLSDKELQNLFADLNTLASVNMLFVPLLHILISRAYLMMLKNEHSESGRKEITKVVKEVAETTVIGFDLMRIYG